MTKRIFRSICLAALAVLLASSGLTMGAMYNYFTRLQLRQLRTETQLAAQGVSREGLAYFSGLENLDCRITWIDSDGTVLYDSIRSSGSMENHLLREEVREALEAGYGESTRYSDTIMEQSLYAAIRLPDGTVVRLSNEQDSVLTLLLDMVRPMLLIIGAAVILALVLASRLSSGVVKPLNNLNLDDPMSNARYEELFPLLRRIESQQLQLRAQESELRQEKKQFDTVTRSMSEGLVLLDIKNTVMAMNPAAARMLGTDKIAAGTDFLLVNRSPDVCELVYNALTGKKGEKIVQLPGGNYQMISSPVRAEDIVSGVVLLILDITEKEKAEVLRREFTANVSHELKTPLHAISGYAELLRSGLVQTGDVPAFSDKIYAEAQRLIRLVEDILRLSRLDEGGADMTWETADLYALVREARENLSAAAELNRVRVEITGQAALLRTIPQLADAIVFNLLDNAIKYNRPGGSVAVTLEPGEETVKLRVSDTGIGIPTEDQSRIFERFYRVDKSHSKAVGGTGLGLSITKHACQILGASISLDSQPEKGTCITVVFPK